MPQDFTILTQLSSLGLGAVIAILVLIWKRGDDSRHENYLVATNATLIQLVEANTASLQVLQKTVETLSAYAQLERRLQDAERRKND